MLVGIVAFAMLLILVPSTVVDSAVRPEVDAFAVFLVVLVVALVSTPVFPSVNSFSIHQVVFPLAFVDPTVGPGVLSLASDVVGFPSALVRAAIKPSDSACAVLEASEVLSHESLAVVPDLSANSMEEVVLELAVVTHDSFLNQLALAVHETVSPESLVLVAVLEPLDALSMHAVILPVALIRLRAVFSRHYTETVTLVILPLTGVVARVTKRFLGQRMTIFVVLLLLRLRALHIPVYFGLVRTIQSHVILGEGFVSLVAPELLDFTLLQVWIVRDDRRFASLEQEDATLSNLAKD